MSLRQKQFYEAYYNYKLNGPVGDEEEKDEKRRKQNTSAGISQSEMVSCLQDFGTANNERTFGFLTFKAIERDLHRINGLEKYKTLQTVLLSKNFITNIAPLSDLRLLTKIDVSENEISSIENLDELLYLESFNLSKNLLTEMPNFAKFRHLSTLDLSHNAISQIDGVRDNVALKVLKLSGNNIEVIKNLDYMNLTELYLDQNNIVQLCNLNTLKKLRALDCSRNKISKLKGLKLLDSLRFLYLSANKIQKIREVHWLSNLNCLTCLDLCHNPLLSKRFYRIQVIYVLQHLRSLDGQKLTAEERENADNFFGMRLDEKKKIFTEILPEEEFIDRRLQTIDMVEPESDSSVEDVDFFDKYENDGTQIQKEPSGKSVKTWNPQSTGKLSDAITKARSSNGLSRPMNNNFDAFTPH